MDELIDGQWYWVVLKGSAGEFEIAMRDSNAAGGWTNCDTWEDYAGQVVAWKHIEMPTYIPFPTTVKR